MAQRHLLIRTTKNIKVDEVDIEGGAVVGHLITDIDPRTLAGMITYRHVDIEDRGDVDDDSLPEAPEPSADVSGLTATVADGSGSGDDGGDVEDVSGSDEAGEVEESSSPANSSAPEDVKATTAYYVSLGLPESTAEALAEASQDPDVPDREFLENIEGLRLWVAEGRDLEELPKIGRTRKAAIEKIL